MSVREAERPPTPTPGAFYLGLRLPAISEPTNDTKASKMVKREQEPKGTQTSGRAVLVSCHGAAEIEYRAP